MTEYSHNLDDAACLREHWHDFTTCDFAGDKEEFVERMEKAGFIELVPVTKEILDDETFADELGLEIGGDCWALTAKGRAAYRGDDNN